MAVLGMFQRQQQRGQHILSRKFANAADQQSRHARDIEDLGSVLLELFTEHGAGTIIRAD